MVGPAHRTAAQKGIVFVTSNPAFCLKQLPTYRYISASILGATTGAGLINKAFSGMKTETPGDRVHKKWIQFNYIATGAMCGYALTPVMPHLLITALAYNSFRNKSAAG